MKDKNKIAELIGPDSEWDQVDTFVFMFYKCPKFGGRDVGIDLEHGTLEVYTTEAPSDSDDDADTEESDNVGVTTVEESYEIKYTLERR